MKYAATVGDQTYIIEVNRENEINVDERAEQVDFRSIDGESLYSLLLDHLSYEAFVEESEGVYHVLVRGRLYTVRVEDERARRLAQAAGGFIPSAGEIQLKAPMPGLIVNIPVEEGQSVEAGQVVAILESMKMENELKTPRAGTVGRIRAKKGDSVEQNQVLITIQ
jgi:biotin carboxyl carrier protein